MRRKGNPSNIREALERTLSQLDIKAKARESLLPYLWRDLVGPAIAGVSRVRMVRGQTLYLDAETPSWATTLSMQSEELLRRINAYFGEKMISDIHVSGRGFEPSRPRRPKKQPTPSEAELEAVVLPAEQLAEIRKQWEAVSNDHLRSLLEMAAARRAKLDCWRLEHGWKRCARCETLFRGRGKTCRLCRDAPERERNN